MGCERTNPDPVSAARHRRQMVLWILTLPILGLATCRRTVDPPSDLLYINTGFENASPLHWQAEAGNLVHVYLVYDQERSSPNRAAGHWFFQVQAKPDAELTFVLHSFKEIWNGKEGSPLSNRTVCYVSADGKAWRLSPQPRGSRTIACGSRSRIPPVRYYLARLEPYGLAELESLKRRLAGNPGWRSRISARRSRAGTWRSSASATRTPPAACSCGPAHPWEAGSNWVVEGLIERLLRDDERRPAVSGQVLRLHHAHGQQGRRRPRADAVQRARGRPEPALGPAGRSRDQSRELRLENWLQARDRRRTGARTF